MSGRGWGRAMITSKGKSTGWVPDGVSEDLGCQIESEMLFVDCLTWQQHGSVSQERICSGSCTCCHSETAVADQTGYITQSQYTDTRSTNPSADPMSPGTWQGSHWSTDFKFAGMVDPEKSPQGKRELNPGQLLERWTP